jgi:transposase
MFKKGISGNPTGRPTGATNNISTVVKKQIETILTGKFTTVSIEQDIAALEPKDRLMVYMKLLEYSIPKMRSIELKADENQNFIITVLAPTRTDRLE